MRKQVPTMLCLFTLVPLVCLWAGLHMAYRHLWMLILLVIFNIFVICMFSVYLIMHNQHFWPAKATYTMYRGTGAATVGRGEISKSKQNLISAMEKLCLSLFDMAVISADWERASLGPSSQPSSVFKQIPQDETCFININLVQDEELQEVDDLIDPRKSLS